MLLNPAEGVPGGLVLLSGSEKSRKVSKRSPSSPVLGSVRSPEQFSGKYWPTDLIEDIHTFANWTSQEYAGKSAISDYSLREKKEKVQINKDIIFLSFGKSLKNSKL